MQHPLVHVMRRRLLEQFNYPPMMVRHLGHQSSYKKPFEAAATANLWKEEQKATALVIDLRGAALEILQTLSDEDVSKYNALTTALELRFRDEQLKEVFPTQLKTRELENLYKLYKIVTANR
ncbi:hypothetical protein Zmor_007017 [Zophobas morio]|uniref:Uncharacterized protein n=1 Tax=Zophobas morio TaxID=2755281 RepID=A0AA38IY43_9CUCU|nr:hypothetical protein Zmor_007017 [Zophobas morio]